jgi:hypothetical protein
MNVQEILNISKQRKIKTKETIKKIIENIHNKIIYYAKLKKETCIYIIPPIVGDSLLYDFEDVIKEVFKTLDTEGYIVTAYPNGQLDISWNEKLVEQKVKTDAYILDQEAKKIKNITKKSKKIDERYNFLANPNKTKQLKDLTLDEQVDLQLQKILKEKQSLQKKYKKML